MFGSKAALAAEKRLIFYDVTEGISGDTVGYNSVMPVVGSISPAQLNGITIKAAYYFTLVPDAFYFYLQGDRTATPEAFFKSLTPQAGAKLLVSARTGIQYNTGNDYTFWWWNSVTKPSRWDGSGSSKLVIELPD